MVPAESTNVQELEYRECESQCHEPKHLDTNNENSRSSDFELAKGNQGKVDLHRQAWWQEDLTLFVCFFYCLFVPRWHLRIVLYIDASHTHWPTTNTSGWPFQKGLISRCELISMRIKGKRNSIHVKKRKNVEFALHWCFLSWVELVNRSLVSKYRASVDVTLSQQGWRDHGLLKSYSDVHTLCLSNRTLDWCSKHRAEFYVPFRA